MPHSFRVWFVAYFGLFFVFVLRLAVVFGFWFLCDGDGQWVVVRQMVVTCLLY